MSVRMELCLSAQALSKLTCRIEVNGLGIVTEHQQKVIGEVQLSEQVPRFTVPLGGVPARPVRERRY